MSEISELIPHTGRMVLLDRILDANAEELTAELIVRGDGYVFGDDQEVPAWVGIEYMAQAVAAYAGSLAKAAHEPIKLGFLLGTRRYQCNVDTFKVGIKLTVHIKKVIQDNGLGVFECRITGDGVEVSANLNVFQPP